MKFAIVLTTYNQKAFLEEALASVRAQTYTGPFQLVVVDDGSTDGTKEIVAGLTSWRDNVKVSAVSNRYNLGVQKAYNIGCFHVDASASWILRLDGDDAFFPDTLEKLAAYLAAQPDGVLLRTGVFFSDLKIMGGEIRRATDWDGTLHGLQYVPHLQAVRNDVSVTLGHWDVELLYSADTDFLIRVVEAGYEIRHIPEVLYLNRHHLGQVTRSLNYTEANAGMYRRLIFDRAKTRDPKLWRA